MNEEGYSWPEALLTLAIVMLIFGTLLPFASAITAQLQLKKLEMYAAETALQGAVYFKAHGLTGGIRRFEKVDFHWAIEGQSICVSYKPEVEELIKCVS